MGYSGAWGKLNKTRKSRGIVPLMHMLRDIWLLALGKQYRDWSKQRERTPGYYQFPLYNHSEPEHIYSCPKQSLVSLYRSHINRKELARE